MTQLRGDVVQLRQSAQGRLQIALEDTLALQAAHRASERKSELRVEELEDEIAVQATHRATERKSELRIEELEDEMAGRIAYSETLQMALMAQKKRA